MTASTSQVVTPNFLRYLLPVPARLALPIGSIAPDFALWDATHDRIVRLANWRGKQPVVLAFTRIFAEEVYCPFCFPHIVAMNEAYDQLRNAGAEVWMITSTNRRQSRGVVDDLQLRLPLLCDPAGTTFRAYHTGQALGAPPAGPVWAGCPGTSPFLPSLFFFAPQCLSPTAAAGAQPAIAGH